MNTSFLKLSVAAALFLLLPIVSFAKEKAAEKDAILLVAFGTTSEPGTRAYKTVEKQVKKEFPDKEILWAYTSEIVRRRLEKKTGLKTFSVTEMLEDLQKRKVRNVAVQSLHVVAGEEFEQLTRQVRQFEASHVDTFEPIKIGRPLLDSKVDMERVVSAVISDLKGKRKAGEALILLGHGHHNGVADLPYVASAAEFSKRDSLIIVSTVEGGVTLDGAAEKLKAAKVKTIWLAPFMVVAGVHTVEDLIGEEESVKADMEAAGFTCKNHVKGLGEYQEIAAIFVDHLKHIVNGSHEGHGH